MDSTLLEELIVDNFAGGGGASTGMELALSRPVDIAINHDPDAVAMHQVNHPHTKHYCESVWDIDPVKVCAGRPVGLAWFSPDCKHFSKAKGGRPVSKNIRGLAWVVLRWAAKVKPRVIMLENVEEFQTWGPLRKGKPDKHRVGETFQQWKSQLEALGYEVEMRELRACDYGAPTIRKRFFVVARRDGRPIVWPKPTHGDPKSEAVRNGKLPPWRTAAEIIDWSLPCPSIFDTSEEIMAKYGLRAVRPLAEATLRRIARGIQKFVIDSPQPFIVDFKYNNSPDSTRNPLHTITSVNGYSVVAPTLIEIGYGEAPNQAPRAPGVERPLGTVVASKKHAVVAAFLSKYYDGGHQGSGNSVTDPLNTITAVDHNAIVSANLIKFQQNSIGQNLEEPVHTIMPGAQRFGLVASHMVKLKGTNIGQQSDQPVQTVTAGGNHFGEVRAFLIKYYGQGNGQSTSEPLHTATSHDTFGLVTIAGMDYAIVDIGLRMLTPRELFNANGFPPDYIIDRDNTGKEYPKSKQVARCGNAVPPQFAEALVRANLPELCGKKITTMAELMQEMAV